MAQHAYRVTVEHHQSEGAVAGAGVPTLGSSATSTVRLGSVLVTPATGREPWASWLATYTGSAWHRSGHRWCTLRCVTIAWQVFIGLVLFAVAFGLLIVLRRAQVAVWMRMRPQFGRAVLVFCVGLVACAVAGGVGYVLSWATS